MGSTMSDTTTKRQHFIRQQIADDLASGKHEQVITRFPPEPNGYLHIGHAKSICLNFGMAAEFNGNCFLRFDDTNPSKEEDEYVRSIMEDVRWLGFDWQENLTHASDNFHLLYDYAVELINKGLAYVDSLSADEIREHRGTLQEPGKPSPYRERSVEENLDLFARMKAGEFQEGEHVLRAKIDMNSGNMNMRDPVIYRILFANHQRTGDEWCIYPMYDFAHPLSDAAEHITHSLCTLEFQDHRPLYDWLIEHLDVPSQPKQYEFSRLNVSHTITSKRKLRQLVEDQHVHDWDDPRMSTLQGMRRRGYPPAAIRNFCESVGISKSDSVIDMSLLEEAVRDELNNTAARAMCVIHPLKIVIENFSDEVQVLTSANHPQNPDMGHREIPFSRELYIERDDFMMEPPNKYFRLAPGREVRLRGAYVIKCEEAIVDPKTGEVIELRCSYDPETLGKNPEGRKVKGVIHWVSAEHAVPVNIRMYDRLFMVENPGAADDFTQHINLNSLHVQHDCLLEPAAANAKPGETFQFERVGYFVVDADSTDKTLVFNKTVGLRDTWNQ